jgi:hypothetical protein
VAREPSTGVYSAVRDARKTLLYCAGGSKGKGLTRVRTYGMYS